MVEIKAEDVFKQQKKLLQFHFKIQPSEQIQKVHMQQTQGLLKRGATIAEVMKKTFSKKLTYQQLY